MSRLPGHSDVAPTLGTSRELDESCDGYAGFSRCSLLCAFCSRAFAAVGAHNRRYGRRSGGAVRKRRLSTQILVSQLTILVATVLVGFGLFAQQERAHLDREYRDRALAIAWTVAGVPLIQEAMEYGDSGNAVQSTAERMKQNSRAAYIVVIDLNGIRHSHPTPSLIGQPVEEPLIVRDGQGHTGVDHGSLGLSANGKAPIYGPSGNLVGEVSAGILESKVDAALYQELPIFALYFGIALAVGVLASYLLARRLKRTTFGLELHDIAALLQEREAMLHGIREGVLGLDDDGRVTVVNDEARRLLGLGTTGLGRPLAELVPTGRLRDVLTGTVGGPDETVLTDEYCLAVNRMPVRLQGRELGAVVTVRDRTELVGVLRELDNVRGLSDALRAQQHEFGNLLDNAIDAAGSAGSVELHLAEDADGITVRVSDDGPGIPADAAAEVFRDGYTTKQPRGELRRGLGLALVQRIVTQAGGTVRLRPGPGAVFTVRLP